MKLPNKHMAVTAGLCALLTVSPVISPVATAFAAEQAGATQANGTVNVTVYGYDEFEGATPVKTVEVEAGSTWGAVKTFFQASVANAPEGKVFDHWTMSGLQGAAIPDDFVINANLIIQPVFKDASEPVQMVQVTAYGYDEFEGATPVKTVEVEAGSTWGDVKAEFPDSVANAPEGQQLAHWTTTGLEGAAIPDSYEINANLIIQPVFEDASTPEPIEWHNVTIYDANGTMQQILPVQDGVTFEQAFEGITPVVPEGKKFVGWAFMRTTNLVPSDYVIGGEFEVYPLTVDEEVPARYIDVTIKDVDGNVIGHGSVLNGTNVWSLSMDAAPEGYTLKGFSVEGSDDVTIPSLTDTVVAVDEQVTELTYVAHYTKNAPEDYYITAELYDDGDLIGTASVLNGTNQWSGLLNPTKPGYEFVGWTLDGSDVIIKNLSELSVTAPEGTVYTYHAHWKKSDPEVRFVDVTYMDGDTVLGHGALQNGTSNWSGPVNPTKDGYTFAGWSIEEVDPELIISDLSSHALAVDDSIESLTLKAHWTKNEAPARFITVHFVDDDGTLISDGAVENGTSNWSGVVNPTKENATFLGWSLEGSDEIIPNINNLVVAVDDTVSELTYRANWEYASEPVAEYHNVTFDDCLPTTENLVVKVEDGKTVSKPADPVCEGYTFEGWYSDTDLTQKYDFSTPVTADMTLWAKWSKNASAEEEKPADEQQKPTKPQEENALPQTGDIAAVATALVASAGAGFAGIGAVLKRRRK